MFSDLLFRLRALFRRSSMEADLDHELRFHFEKEVAKYVQSGLSPEEARRRARLAFGGLDQVREDCREARGINLLETLIQDIRYALRILRRTPVITAVAIFSLALGIGANTAIFTLIDAVLLRSLPLRDPQQLVQLLIRKGVSGEDGTGFTNPLWEQVRDRQDIFSGAVACSDSQFDLAKGGAVQNVNGIFTSGDYFNVLGVQPILGRSLTTADDQRGCPGVAVLSYGFWQEHFGGAPSAIGSMLSLDKHSFEIVGVARPGFYGTSPGVKFDVAVPICAAAIFDGDASRIEKRSMWWLEVIARQKQGTSPQQLKARLSALSPQIFAAALPQNWNHDMQQNFLRRQLDTAPASAGTTHLREQFGQPLEILMAVVALVLLIACANIASLMLARAAARTREIAVRIALGASRTRLIRQLLTECVLLSACGALLGVLFARWGNAFLVRYISTPRSAVFLDLSVDVRTLFFTAAVAVLTGLLFGVLPAFRSTRVSLVAAMKGSGLPETPGRARFRPGKWIVSSQIALSLVLLVVAGLFLRSLVKLATLDIGFDRSNVLLVNANLKTANVAPEQRLVTYQHIEARLRLIPGVVSASRSIITPIGGMFWNDELHVDTSNPPSGDDALVDFNFISPAYFQTLRTPILAGRIFSDRDSKTAPNVAIVNETLARKFFPNANAVGKYFRYGDSARVSVPPTEIVGVVRDAKYGSLREKPAAQAFFPVSQVPEFDESETFELRTASRPSTLASAVQQAVAEVNKGVSLEFHTLAEQVDASLVEDRLLATLSAFFGGLALFLAAIGLYGALSFLVRQRQTEFGVRMALGAPRASILRLVIRDVMVVLAGGIAAGLAISLAAVRFLQKMLFGLAPHDAATMLGAVFVLAAVALVAAYLPARRASSVDPMVALRYE